MKHIINRTNRCLRIAAILLCSLIVLGTAPQSQIAPTMTGFSVTPFATVSRARGTAFDSAGNLLTLDPDAGIVYSINTSGQMRVLADLPDFVAGYVGPAFEQISGNVFVSQYMNQSGNEVLRIAPDGAVSVFALGIPAPTSMTTDASGDLYVSSYACPASVYKVTPSGMVSTFATGLCRADGLAFDEAGNLYICDRGTNRIMRVPPTGGAATEFASGFNIPTGIAFDRQGNLLVVNSNDGTIMQVSPQGVSGLFGSDFTNPVALAFDHSDQIFIADLGAGQIFKATPIDVAPPIADRLTINGGALTTTSSNVRLDVSAANMDGSQVGLSMSFSNDGDSWSAWNPYVASTLWQLTSDDGMKIVYGRFKNSAGALSDVVSDTITLDTSVQSEYGVTINDGALYTNQTEVRLTISAKSRTAEIQVSNDGGFNGVAWEPYTSHKAWQITQYRHEEVTRLVYIRFRDVDGNVSATYLDDIILDVNPPGGDMHITRTDQGTLLYLSATDDVSGVEGMRLSARPDFAGASWEPFTSTRTWDFGDSSTVYVQFRDHAGNASPTYAASLSGRLSVFLPLVRR
jgi:hypothetical protein